VKDSILHLPASILIYEEGDLDGLDVRQVGEYLTEKTSLPFHLKGYLGSNVTEERAKTASERLARIKVRDPGRKFVWEESLPAEIEYERRRIREPHWKIFGIFYEGIFYQEIISGLISERGLDLDHCALLFTNQLFVTWDRKDSRYHARTSLYGFPNLISLPGLVEAPAKPRAFYIKKRMGVSVEELKEEFEGQFIDYGDSRITEVMKGYAMQALFFHLSGEPFCEDPNCRLFNSHWQEEVLHSQLDSPYEFCRRHETILEGLRKGR
jgi:hypothetical protein